MFYVFLPGLSELRLARDTEANVISSPARSLSPGTTQTEAMTPILCAATFQSAGCFHTAPKPMEFLLSALGWRMEGGECGARL